MNKALLALATTGLLGFSTTASADSAAGFGPFVNGTYAIGIYHDYVGVFGCMRDAPDGGTPTFRHESGIVDCTTRKDAALRHLWDVYPLTNHGARTVHIIKSRASGKCLIRTSNGTSRTPVTHLWGESADKRYCGFRTMEDLVANGQAVWEFGSFSTYWMDTGGVTYIGWPRMPAYADGYITWGDGRGEPVVPQFSTGGNWRWFFQPHLP